MSVPVAQVHGGPAVGLPPGVLLGGLGRRFGAFVIDLLPAVVALVVALVVGSPLVWLICGLVAVIWFAVCVALFGRRAAGPGMLALRLQLVGMRNGRPLATSRFLLRSLILFALSLTVVGVLIMVFLLVQQRRRQGWPDLAVGSVVIVARTLPARRRPAATPSTTADDTADATADDTPDGTPETTTGPTSAATPTEPDDHPTRPVDQPGRAADESPLTAARTLPAEREAVPEHEGSTEPEASAESGEPGEPDGAGESIEPGEAAEAGETDADGEPERPPTSVLLTEADVDGAPEPADEVPAAAGPTPEQPSGPDPAADHEAAEGPEHEHAEAEPAVGPEVEPEPAAGGEAAPEPAAEPEPEPGVGPELVAGPEVEPDAEPDAEPEPAGSSAPTDRDYEIVLDDDRVLELRPLMLLGRNPQPGAGDDGAVLIKVRDETRTVSKLHLTLEVDPTGVYVVDRESTNGSAITTAAGEYDLLAPGRRYRLQLGDTVAFGDHRLVLRPTR